MRDAYTFGSEEAALAFLAEVDKGEGYPNPDTRTERYALPLEHWKDGRWAVFRDATIDRYAAALGLAPEEGAVDAPWFKPAF